MVPRQHLNSSSAIAAYTILAISALGEPGVAQLRSLTDVGQYADTLSIVEVETERSGLIYAIGRVEKTIHGAALIDLGDAHSLGIAPPGNNVAVFRATENRYIPVGVLTIAESYATYSLTRPSPVTKPQAGDVVMFVRELAEMQSARQRRDDFIRTQIIRNANATGYSTIRRPDTAKALRVYDRGHRKWERSQANVIGFLNGESFGSGREKTLSKLLSYIEMMREDHRIGRNSLTAAGKSWSTTVSVLFGDTVTAQHAAAQNVETEDAFLTNERRPEDRDIQREVLLRFFDRAVEQQNMLGYLIASLAENSPKNQDIWFQHAILRTQFPELADEEFVLEQVREILKVLRDTN